MNITVLLSFAIMLVIILYFHVELCDGKPTRTARYIARFLLLACLLCWLLIVSAYFSLFASKTVYTDQVIEVSCVIDQEKEYSCTLQNGNMKIEGYTETDEHLFFDTLLKKYYFIPSEEIKIEKITATSWKYAETDVLSKIAEILHVNIPKVYRKKENVTFYNIYAPEDVIEKIVEVE